MAKPFSIESKYPKIYSTAIVSIVNKLFMENTEFLVVDNTAMAPVWDSPMLTHW